MKKQLITLLFAGFTVTVPAATVLIDFGRSTNTTPGYNNVGETNAFTIANLNDTTSSATGWSINVANSGTGVNPGFGVAGAGANVAAFPAALSSFATTALQDSIFSNAASGSLSSQTVTIGGLSTLETYDLLFYGSRSNGQDVLQNWTMVQGTGGATISHQSLANTTTVVNWAGIVPNASGVISFTISGTSTPTGSATALNFGSITSAPVPEPTSMVFAALAGVVCVSRRRRA
jgi:hypothetical protein